MWLERRGTKKHFEKWQCPILKMVAILQILLPCLGQASNLKQPNAVDQGRATEFEFPRPILSQRVGAWRMARGRGQPNLPTLQVQTPQIRESAEQNPKPCGLKTCAHVCMYIYIAIYIYCIYIHIYIYIYMCVCVCVFTHVSSPTSTQKSTRASTLPMLRQDEGKQGLRCLL